MQSTPYYVPLHPSYSLRASANYSNKGSLAKDTSTAHLGEKQEDPVAGFLADRLRIVEASIRQVVQEIESREHLREITTKEIDEETCAQKTMLHQVAPHGACPFTVGDTRRRAAIEGEIAALGKERRHEQTGAWKDVSTLKKELRELLREYMDEKRKEKAVMSP